MREQFEAQLHEYNAVVRELMDPETTGGDARRVSAELKRDVKRAAHEAQTSTDIERQIVGLQEEKQRVMKKLHAELSAVDNPETEVPKERDARSVIAADDTLSVEAADGRLSKITIGELLTDAEWGIAYAPDASVSRDIRKRYAIEKARTELRPLLDEQIILEEGGSEATHYRKRDAYQRIHERRERGEMPAGIIAEKMVRNFLKKLSVDTGVDFTVLDADVYQDVEKKIDFIIRRRSHHRGVRVEANPHAERVGVQMTTSASPDLLAHKHEQVERSKHHLKSVDEVDDIVLVSLPLHNVTKLYARWNETKTSGGPDKLWDDATRETIFRDVLAGVFTQDELEEEWGRAQEDRLPPPM